MHNLDVCSILLEVTAILFLLVQMLSNTKKKIKPFIIITRRLLYSYNFYIYYNSAGIEVSLYYLQAYTMTIFVSTLKSYYKSFITLDMPKRRSVQVMHYKISIRTYICTFFFNYTNKFAKKILLHKALELRNIS